MEKVLSWKVPNLKTLTENDTSNESNDIEISTTNALDKLLPEIKNFDSNVVGNGDDDDIDDDDNNNESHFMYPWSSTKQLETIGEDEEDNTVTEENNGK